MGNFSDDSRLPGNSISNLELGDFVETGCSRGTESGYRCVTLRCEQYNDDDDTSTLAPSSETSVSSMASVEGSANDRSTIPILDFAACCQCASFHKLAATMAEADFVDAVPARHALDHAQ